MTEQKTARTPKFVAPPGYDDYQPFVNAVEDDVATAEFVRRCMFLTMKDGRMVEVQPQGYGFAVAIWKKGIRKICPDDLEPNESLVFWAIVNE
ncbi:MAG TPA: hypothetical protein VNM40_04385 [Candidatus Paceibacterota bacterium]|nr:hypothetical protein [Candidatus Paceibacterota bacterium]